MGVVMPLALVTIEETKDKAMLTTECIDVTFPLSIEMRQIIADMKEKFLELQGVGLAAPQVGKHVKIIVYQITEDARAIRHDGFDVVPLTVLINPKYFPLHPHEKMVQDWEACFSVKTKAGKVPRFQAIRYTAFDEEGNPVEGVAKGFSARVLQHEIDHIHGTLIIDRLTSECIQGHPDDMRKRRYEELSKSQKAVWDEMSQQNHHPKKVEE